MRERAQRGQSLFHPSDQSLPQHDTPAEPHPEWEPIQRTKVGGNGSAELRENLRRFLEAYQQEME